MSLIIHTRYGTHRPNGEARKDAGIWNLVSARENNQKVPGYYRLRREVRRFASEWFQDRDEAIIAIGNIGGSLWEDFISDVADALGTAAAKVAEIDPWEAVVNAQWKKESYNG